MRHNSHCIVCKKPARAPRGNYNAKLVTLCKSVVCRRKRKSELQRERRKQKLMDFVKPTGPGKSKHDSMPRSRKKREARKRAFFGQQS